jgi:aminopeptidase
MSAIEMNVLNRYAKLLVEYCLELKKGDQVFIQSTTLAEELVREVYREAIIAGAHPEVSFSFRGKNKIFLDHAADHQLDYVSPTSKYIIENFDAYLSIRAPYNLREDANVDSTKRARSAQSSKEVNEIFSKRTADGTLRRTLCQYPSEASAQEAGMSLEEYQEFVFQACHLYDDDPAASWRKVRTEQQRFVNHLNQSNLIRYKNHKTDITFSVAGRTWINSDGRVNMPSGEVYTGPVEESVQGTVHFDYPSIYMGQEVQGVTFEVLNGKIVKWHAEKGQEVLDDIMKIDGARFFGEAAIGTNYNIQKATKNILFDEKIGGTVHMAIGQSYIQTGGKNKSVVHWDLIADMKNGGEIYTDGDLIYKDGQFLIR